MVSEDSSTYVINTMAAYARMRYYYPTAPVELDSARSNNTVSIQPKYARGRFECAEQKLQPQDMQQRAPWKCSSTTAS